MKKMTGEEIINTYIDFFVERGHLKVESASLIPQDDPSVLWINAGVTPLKKYFDGSEVPKCRRLTSCQKCIRTGDIESVGITARHHTFFQMLGNFSIGDYFKTEALTWAYELLTSEKYFGIPKDKLYVTVYTTDDEAYNLWLKLGVDKSHIVRLEGNYWEIGEGPSGPDSEIFFDRGEKYDKEKQGIKLLEQEIENDRYIEIWNNVFSQYNAKDGVDRKDYEELPSKNIDTGMGVERMACIMQGTETNYETDLFMPIIEELSNICNLGYVGQKEFKVIVDHVRSLTFALADGATFENYGRGYVLRRLLRRSVMMGRKLGINHPFMSDLVDVVISKYGSIYPNIVTNKELVKELILKEEELFEKTLISGEKRLEEIFNSNIKIISGEEAFKLYDTYGFPVELTMEYASERGIDVDRDGFDKYMSMQKEMARNNHKNVSSMNLQNELLINYKEESNFVGYDTLGNKTIVMDIIHDDKFVDSINDEGYIFIKDNPFYAESGGQIYDTGYIKNDECKLEVIDVIKAPNGQHLLHVKVLSGVLKKNSEILTHVLEDRRNSIARNHSSTHLLQKTLQDLLGDKVHQAGSRVDDKSFRFDFTYHGRLNDEVITKLEEDVNKRVEASYDTKIEFLSLDEAKKRGAMALFSEKYGDVVRMVTMGDSVELCAGTHVKNTKDIDKIAIIALENKGADTYRIEGATKNNINHMLHDAVSPYVLEMKKLLEKARNIVDEAINCDIKLKFDFKFDFDGVLDSYNDVISYKHDLALLKDKLKMLEKEYKEEKTKKSLSDLTAFTANMEVINGIKSCVVILNDYEIDIMKQIADVICNKYENCFVMLANVTDNNVNVIAKSNCDKINCGAIVKEFSIACSGNGGGSKTFAQGGGSDATNISKYLDEVKVKIADIN